MGRNQDRREMFWAMDTRWSTHYKQWWAIHWQLDLDIAQKQDAGQDAQDDHLEGTSDKRKVPRIKQEKKRNTEGVLQLEQE
jgi:hypothetical protein